MPLIIGFTGKAGCGKSTVAHATTTHVFSYASRLKHIAKQLGWDGEKDDKGRRLLQVLGDVGREYKSQLWVHYTAGEIEDQLTDDNYFSDVAIYGIDDLRFENEAQWVKDNDGIVIHLEHDELLIKNKELAAHKSEAGIPKGYYDYTVKWGKLEDVIKQVKGIIKEEYGHRQNTSTGSARKVKKESNSIR